MHKTRIWLGRSWYKKFYNSSMNKKTYWVRKNKRKERTYTSSSYLSISGYKAEIKASYFGSSLKERRLAQCVRQAGHSLFLQWYQSPIWLIKNILACTSKILINLYDHPKPTPQKKFGPKVSINQILIRKTVWWHTQAASICQCIPCRSDAGIPLLFEFSEWSLYIWKQRNQCFFFLLQYLISGEGKGTMKLKRKMLIG